MLTLSNAIADFEQSNIADGLRDKTVSSYTDRLTQFCKIGGADAPLSEITPKQIREYISERRNRLAKATVDSDLRSLHRFFRWCSLEYGLPNPMRNIKRPKFDKNPTIKAINPDDFVKMLEATTDDIAGRRDRALLAWLADTGARRGGAESLTLENLDTALRKAFVTEKGGKQRYVNFSHFTAQLLTRWLTVRPLTKSEYVFVSLRHGQEGTPLTGSGIYQICRRVGRKAQVKRYNPHAFRHNFSRLFIQNGGDISVLAKLLGNSIEVASAYYAVFAPDELQALQDKYSPIKNMLKNHGD